MIVNFGSINIDHVYKVDRIAKPGETVSSSGYSVFAGGKGANQSMAIAMAGGSVRHVGAVGPEGAWMISRMREAGVDVSFVRTCTEAGGHAIIQVDKSGQNAIVVHGGTNHLIETGAIDAALHDTKAGDLVLVQNEISNVAYVIAQAHARGLMVCVNPSPMDSGVAAWPLDQVGIFIINEHEGEAITGKTNAKSILDEMRIRFPSARVVLTLGAAGAVYADEKDRVRAEGHKVRAVDTTGAGDTFTGYFLAAMELGKSPAESLETANMASAIAVTQAGASKKLARIGELVVPAAE